MPVGTSSKILKNGDNLGHYFNTLWKPIYSSLNLQLNRDNSGHISLLLPNLLQSTSYQTMKIGKFRTKSGQIETKLGKKWRNVVQKCMKIANVPIFSPKYSQFSTLSRSSGWLKTLISGKFSKQAGTELCQAQMY